MVGTGEEYDKQSRGGWAPTYLQSIRTSKAATTGVPSQSEFSVGAIPYPSQPFAQEAK
jgi:hypothetical protein